ncbi:hypothetical protein DE146DRAFT_525737 [Phaeosphaeria sp. MPI-PUGE-AT-0046c]|nr:hypothetical protein DE146DRAFT_525737 [Phaeosphaeria sp. MPI-PUGE-AT-0046c]
MRVKMASVSASTLTPRTNNTLHCTLHTFASQANDAAIALYTITQLCSSRFGSTGIQRDIAHSFLRVAGVLSSLLTTCDLDFLPEIVRLHLNTHAERCQPLLQRVDSAIGKLHAHYEVSERRGERVSESFGAFGRDAEREVADHLEQFFNMALRVRLRWSTIEPAKFGDRYVGCTGGCATIY